jgi:hemerythrin-like domain-containing protein
MNSTRQLKNFVIIILLIGCIEIVLFPIENSYKIKGEYVEEKKEERITLTEDLMREHGVLNRLLLIYEEIIRRIEQNELAKNALAQSVNIVQEFIENYHEKLEEDYVFPLFEKNKKQVNLVKTLRKQHTRGKAITAKLKEIINTNLSKNDKTINKISDLLKKFIKMYRPHKAREDTVIFPQIRSLLSENAFEEMGEKFEDLEHKLFGEEGFLRIVKKVEAIEKELNIYNLEQFTP